MAVDDKLSKLRNVLPFRQVHKHLTGLWLALLLLAFLGCAQTSQLKEGDQRKVDEATQLVEVGKDYFDAKQYEEARKVLKEAIKIDSSNVEAHRWLVFTLREMVTKGYDEKTYENTRYRRNLVKEGYKALDKAIRLAPEDGELRLMRGIDGVKVPFFARRLNQAMDDLNMVLRSDVSKSTKAEAYYWLGQAYQKKAMSYWIKVVRKSPNSEEAKMIFARMRPTLRRFDLSEYHPPVLAIDFMLGFPDEIEPQTAVWIEDREGNFVKTIYVSGFSGHVKEKEVRLPTWANSSKFVDVDAVTGASINLGQHVYVWDLKDNSGSTVEPGEYVVKVEVKHWPSMQYQLVSAAINLGEKVDRTVVEEGYIIPYLKVTYFPVRGG